MIGERIKILIPIQVVIYLTVGVVSNLSDISIFWILNQFGVYYLVSSAISTALGLTINFIAHRKITFRANAEVLGQIQRYILIIAFNYIVSQSLLVLLIEGTGLPELVAKVVSLLLVAMYNYFLLRLWVFKPKVVNKSV